MLSKKQKTDPAVLLLHTILLMATAGEGASDRELGQVEGHFHTVPEFRGRDFTDLYDLAERLLRSYRTQLESVDALRALPTGALRNRAMYLALEVAMASGDQDETEIQLLDRIAEVLDIPEDDATAMLEAIKLKYQAA